MYGRFTENDKVIVVVNNADAEVSVTVPVWRIEIPMNTTMTRLLYSCETGYTTEQREYPVKDGNLSLQMGRYSAIIIAFQ